MKEELITMLKAGDKAPEFSLPAQDGKTYSLEDFADHTLIMFFYIKDNTPGWTSEAVSFRDNLETLEGFGARVVGVSKDSLESHKKFAEKYDLGYPLLADTEGELCKKFDVLNIAGIVKRSTFIIEKGEIIKVFPKVKVAEHLEEIIEFFQERQ